MKLNDLTGQKFNKLTVLNRAENKIDSSCKLHNIPLLRIPYTLSTEDIKKQVYEYYLSLTTAGCA